jgi:hypothetical protein
MTGARPVKMGFLAGCIVLMMPGAAATPAPRELDPREQAVVTEHGIDNVVLRVTEGTSAVALGSHRETGQPWAVTMSQGFPRAAGPVDLEVQGGDVGDAHLALYGRFAQPGGSAIVSSPGVRPRRASQARDLWAVIVPAKWQREAIEVRIYDRRGTFVEATELPRR